MKRVLASIATLIAISSMTFVSPAQAVVVATPSLVANPPNVMVIVTDDQRLQGTMAYMPKTLALFDQGGTEFTHPYAATPLCCPARGSIRSGRYAHNHGVLFNPQVGAPAPQEDAYNQAWTIESELQDERLRHGHRRQVLERLAAEQGPAELRQVGDLHGWLQQRAVQRQRHDPYG